MNMPVEGFNDGGHGQVFVPQWPAVKGDGGTKPVTLAMVAREARCSQGAVSSLLNDRDYGIRVSPATRARIIAACRKLGYIPNDLRAFVRVYPERGETALLLSTAMTHGAQNPFVSRLVGAIVELEKLRSGAIEIILYDELREYRSEEEFPTPIRHGVASKFFCVGAPNDSLCRIIRSRDLPVIFLGHQSDIAGTTSIVPDYERAARLTLEMLTRLGHSTIGIVGGPFGDPEPRLGEMSRAIGKIGGELGLSFQHDALFHGNLTFSAGVGALNAMRVRRNQPTALICLSESAALGALAAANAHNIRVPEDLSIVAYADHRGSLDSYLPVTSIVLPISELAEAAVSEADARLLQGFADPSVKTIIPVELIERSTTGPAPK